jgi:hypothetical protein
MLLRNLSPEKLPGAPAGTKFGLCNSQSFNILHSNPLIAIFYPDRSRLLAANSSILKDLEIQSGDFFNPDHPFAQIARKEYSRPGRGSH